MADSLLPSTQRTDEELEDLIAALSPGVRYLALSKFKLPRPWAAELASEGFCNEEMMAQMGDSREDVMQTLQLTLGLQDSTKDGRKLCIQILAIKQACKDKAPADSARESDASSNGRVLAMDGGEWNACFENLSRVYPGLILLREKRPFPLYMGLLEAMTKSNYWSAEEITQVIAVDDKNSLKSGLVPAGALNHVAWSTSALIGFPMASEKLKARCKTMGSPG